MLINLLPHRAWALARKRKNFIISLALAALLGLVLAAGVRVWLGQQLSAQMSANSLLTIEISAVDKQLKEMSQVNEEMVKLRLRESTLQALQDERQLSAVWLQELAEHLPDGLYLTALKQDGDKVIVNGMARSDEQVFELLRQIASPGRWLAQAELIEVTGAPLTLDALALTGTPFAMRALLKRPAGRDAAHVAQPISATH
jgi:type IV pilus assembly protein PilN